MIIQLETLVQSLMEIEGSWWTALLWRGGMSPRETMSQAWEGTPEIYSDRSEFCWCILILHWFQLGFPRRLSGWRICLKGRRHGRRGFSPWVGKIPWRRKWQSTLVFLSGESHGQRSLVDYSPKGCKETWLRDWALYQLDVNKHGGKERNRRNFCLIPRNRNLGYIGMSAMGLAPG